MLKVGFLFYYILWV